MIHSITTPKTLPVSVMAAKNYLKIDHDDEDASIKQLIESATGLVEQETGQTLLTRTWHIRSSGVDTADGAIRVCLPYPPLISITSVAAIVSSTITRPLENYTVEWERPIPSLKIFSLSKSFDIVYKAGYGDRDLDLPPPLQQAILLLVADMYEQRTATIKIDSNALVRALLRPYCQPPFS